MHGVPIGHHIYTLGLPTLRWVHPGQSMSSCRSSEPTGISNKCCIDPIGLDVLRPSRWFVLQNPVFSDGGWWKWLHFPFATNGNRTNEWISLQYIYFTSRRSLKKFNNTIHSLSGMVYLLMRFTVPCDRCGSWGNLQVAKLQPVTWKVGFEHAVI